MISTAECNSLQFLGVAIYSGTTQHRLGMGHRAGFAGESRANAHELSPWIRAFCEGVRTMHDVLIVIVFLLMVLCPAVLASLPRAEKDDDA